MAFIYAILILLIISGIGTITYIIYYNALQDCKVKIDEAESMIDEALRSKYDILLKLESLIKTNIKETKIEQMDLILCATVSHKQLVLNMYPELTGKVYTLKEYVGIGKEGKNMDIKDPWGCNIEIYKQCAEEIKQCLEMLIDNNSKKGI